MPSSSKDTGATLPCRYSAYIIIPDHSARSACAAFAVASILRAPASQLSTQDPQSVHFSLTTATPSTTLRASKVQTSSQTPQPMQVSISIRSIIKDTIQVYAPAVQPAHQQSRAA